MSEEAVKPPQEITDRMSIQHKAVCLKAGVIPGTSYALKFCEYLLGTGSTDWFVVGEKNTKFKGKELKEYKKAWLKERAGAKSDAEAADAQLQSSQSKEAIAAAEEAEKQANTTKEKLTAQQNKLSTIKQQIRKLEREKNDVVRTQAGSSKEGLIKQLDTQIKQYQDQIKSVEQSIESTKKLLDIEKELAKEAEKEAKEFAQGNKWWYKQLVKYKQEEFKLTAEKEGKRAKKVLDEYNVEDIITLSVYANDYFSKSKGRLCWTDFDSDETLGDRLKSFSGDIWKKYPSITSIKNDLPAEVLEKAEAITPDTSAAMLQGAISNTFECAMAGKELIQNPEILLQRATFLADVTTAALNKLTTRVTDAVTMSIAQITDVSCITRIPADAAQEMMKHILTADQVMALITKALNDDSIKDEATKMIEDKINATKDKINEKVQEINFLIGDKLSAFNKMVGDVKGAINQASDWYIDNVNKLENQIEKEAMKAISDVTLNLLDTKFQFVDATVEAMAYNLVMPVNEALIKVQLEVLRKITQAIKKATAIAKAAAQKAVMFLLGFLGA